MFKIGDFAQIGRVSGRQLRHYDNLGLLQPSYTDPKTGYRYYSAQQLPRLNRILALKSLGFSLDQIGKMLNEDVPPQELRGMLTMKKAQVEQSLAEERMKLRQIEARILQIEEQGGLRDYDVSARSIAAQPFLSVRQICPDMSETVRLVAMVAREGGGRVKAALRDKLIVIAHSDFDDEPLDLEVGFALTRPISRTVPLPDDLEMHPRGLEAVETIASIVRTGPLYQSHLAYGALGIWMEANDYQIDGPCREIFLEMPSFKAETEDVVMEIQFPVRKAD